jgi:hypothetical protein
MTAVWLSLALLQTPTVEDQIAAFLKGDAGARADLVRRGVYALRPLIAARELKADDKLNALITELKRDAAQPRPARFDADFNRGTRGCSGLLNAHMVHSLGRDFIPLFLDHASLPKAKTTAIRVDNATSSLALVEEICRQTGLDYAYYHNHIVIGAPERLWPLPPASKTGELTRDQQERATRLVEQLNDELIESREAASRELYNLGPAAIPILQLGARRAEAEIVARCRHLIQLLTGGEFVYGSPAAARQRLGDRGRAILNGLRSRKLSMSFEKSTLGLVADLITRTCGEPCEVPGALAEKPVTLGMTDQAAFDILALMTQSMDLGFAIQGDKVLIDHREAIEKLILER